ncbi:DNA polymerase-3 subunit epsilon [Pseudomonas sp. SJZ080]|uniref:3'-5' exonuclease n=1 Tax=Pseudomonas sp. SJZ080 TaxID=2572888 RepID=UPI001199A349|nr:3'-5' exonuclease [Pseudomonas sp. SJZ080]TWC44535.1 DNA polymerase-3 subunit epsilon [Pseudomonas sp. SJZ080]
MSDVNAEPDHPGNWPEVFRELAEKSANSCLRTFYQAGVVSPHTPIESVQFLAMDVETTGLDAQAHSIVSIGLVPFTLKRIFCSKAEYWVLNPSSELSEKSVTFHHITHAEILNAPSLPEVLEPLLQAMAGKVIVVHYRNIEREFLDAALRRHLGEGLRFPVVDTMQLEARMHRQKQSWAARLMRRPQTSIRLADSRSRYNLPAYQGHHALTDALATAELLQAQIATHYSSASPIGALWD